jgi:hypothetical protein
MIAKIILILINLIGVGYCIGKHGTKRDSTYNGYHSFISLIILAFLYYYAGVLNLIN